MTKKQVPAAKSTATAPAAAPIMVRKDGIRETVESVVIAFMLAFLFRAFEAEAFVIPTGSMAPTLMGVHKDLTCEECGYPYRIGSSEEQDDDAQRLASDMGNSRLSPEQREAAANALADRELRTAVCPNCRFEMDEVSRFPTYKGDRILVSKFPYDFADPDRWDVAVFKYPLCSSENYIKRVVGLPNETLIIHGGNIYTSHGDGSERAIERKPPDKVRAIMQIVYDNDYILPELVAAGLPQRWQWMPEAGGAAWVALEGDKAYRHEGAGGESWLGYQHLVPTPQEWKSYGASGKFATDARPVEPRLVSDFYAYNAGRKRGERDRYDADYAGMHWVGDLILECDLKIETANDGANVTFRLIKGGQSYDCRIDAQTGQASIWIDGVDQQNQADTGIRPGSAHKVSYANVDCQLMLWVDGDLIEFPQPTTYNPTERLIPTKEDLTPARIGAQGATVEVSHLRLLRDVYYIATTNSDGDNMLSDFEWGARPGGAGDNSNYASFLGRPSMWPEMFSRTRTASFPLGEDEFLMLGDNSPKSSDGRLWKGRDNGRQEYYVKRDLLIGKAVFVYWPHSWNKIPGTGIPFPFFPNFERMKFVR